MTEETIQVEILPTLNEYYYNAFYNGEMIKLDFLSMDALDVEKDIVGIHTVMGYWDNEFVVSKLHT